MWRDKRLGRFTPLQRVFFFFFFAKVYVKNVSWIWTRVVELSFGDTKRYNLHITKELGSSRYSLCRLIHESFFFLFGLDNKEFIKNRNYISNTSVITESILYSVSNISLIVTCLSFFICMCLYVCMHSYGRVTWVYMHVFVWKSPICMCIYAYELVNCVCRFLCVYAYRRDLYMYI